MKVLDIVKENPDGSLQVVNEFSAKELQSLLQLAVNVSASIGLTAERDARVASEDNHELND